MKEKVGDGVLQKILLEHQPGGKRNRNYYNVEDSGKIYIGMQHHFVTDKLVKSCYMALLRESQEDAHLLYIYTASG